MKKIHFTVTDRQYNILKNFQTICLKRLLNIIKLTWLKAKKTIFYVLNQIAKTISEYLKNIPNLNMPSHAYKRPNSLEPDPTLYLEFLTSLK